MNRNREYIENQFKQILAEMIMKEISEYRVMKKPTMNGIEYEIKIRLTEREMNG